MGTPKCARKRWPGSDTRWLGLPGHGAGVREVCGSKPGGATTLAHPISHQIGFSGSGLGLL